jgi:hypothetical protein
VRSRWSEFLEALAGSEQNKIQTTREESTMTSEREAMLRRTLPRRAVLQGAVGIGAASLAVGMPLVRPRRVGAQATPKFTREASITSWGFGAEDTNPLAYSRVNA